jgi:hypothetical protein
LEKSLKSMELLDSSRSDDDGEEEAVEVEDEEKKKEPTFSLGNDELLEDEAFCLEKWGCSHGLLNGGIKNLETERV